MPEVGGGSLSQCCQCLSPIRQTKLTKVHFNTRELVLASVAGFVKIKDSIIAPKPDDPVN